MKLQKASVDESVQKERVQVEEVTELQFPCEEKVSKIIVAN